MAHPQTAIEPLLGRVQDSSFLGELVATVESVSAALAKADKLELDEYELDPQLEDGMPVWTALEPAVTDMLVSVQHTALEASRRFPRDATVTSDLKDLDLALALEDLDNGLPSPIRDAFETRLEDCLKRVSPGQSDTLRPSLGALAAMLDDLASEHAGRLSSPYLRADPDFLLAELHELRSRCEQTLETITAAIIRGLTESPVHEVFPRHRPAGGRAARVRAWALDLSITLQSLPSPARDTEAALEAAVKALGVSARGAELRWLRAADRAEVQAFRRWLRSHARPDAQEATHRFAAFLKWARSMDRINRRRVLIEHDAHAFKALMDLLEGACSGRALLPTMEDLYGREPTLDELVREGRNGATPQASQVKEVMKLVKEAIEAAC